MASSASSDSGDVEYRIRLDQERKYTAALEDERYQLEQKIKSLENEVQNVYTSAMFTDMTRATEDGYWREKGDKEVKLRLPRAPSPPPSFVGSYCPPPQPTPGPAPANVTRGYVYRAPSPPPPSMPVTTTGHTYIYRAPSPPPSPKQKPVRQYVYQAPPPPVPSASRYKAGTEVVRREVTPNKYDGRTKWRDYYTHFSACQKLNQWTESEACHWLATRLEGPALAVLQEDVAEMTLEGLLSRLEERFGRGQSAENYLLELKARRRQPKETIPELGQAIRELTSLAYPDMSRDVRERLAKEHFKDAVNDQQLRTAIFQCKPATLDEAVTAALEMESFLQAEMARVRPKSTSNLNPFSRVLSESSEVEERLKKIENDMQQLLTTVSSSNVQQRGQQVKVREVDAVCYYCGEVGHFKRNCPVCSRSGNSYGPPQWAMGRPQSGSLGPQPRQPPPPQQRQPPPLPQTQPPPQHRQP